MKNEPKLRVFTTHEMRSALLNMIKGSPKRSIPSQFDDDDMILDEGISELARARTALELVKAQLIGYEQSWRKYTELAESGDADAKILAAHMEGRVLALRGVIEDMEWRAPK